MKSEPAVRAAPLRTRVGARLVSVGTMTAVADPGALLDAYRDLVEQRREGVDETLLVRGTRPHTHALIATIERLGIEGLLDRREETRRFVSDDGITYGTGEPAQTAEESDEPRTAGPWSVDPLPLVIGNEEWSGLERGVRQRAHLLDTVLTDLSGPQRLVRDGVIPGQVVYGHGGWLPQAEGITLPGKHQLVLPATDLARDADGTWRVSSIRAPEGVH